MSTTDCSSIACALSTYLLSLVWFSFCRGSLRSPSLTPTWRPTRTRSSACSSPLRPWGACIRIASADAVHANSLLVLSRVGQCGLLMPCTLCARAAGTTCTCWVYRRLCRTTSSTPSPSTQVRESVCTLQMQWSRKSCPMRASALCTTLCVVTKKQALVVCATSVQGEGSDSI